MTRFPVLRLGLRLWFAGERLLAFPSLDGMTFEVTEEGRTLIRLEDRR